jgi:hypothetical protein
VVVVEQWRDNICQRTIWRLKHVDGHWQLNPLSAHLGRTITLSNNLSHHIGRDDIKVKIAGLVIWTGGPFSRAHDSTLAN